MVSGIFIYLISIAYADTWLKYSVGGMNVTSVIPGNDGDYD